MEPVISTEVFVGNKHLARDVVVAKGGVISGARVSAPEFYDTTRQKVLPVDLTLSPREVENATTVTMTANDGAILINSAPGPSSVILPALSGLVGRVFVVKDSGNFAFTSNITISGDAPIDSSPDYIVSENRASVMLLAGLTQWHVISVYGGLPSNNP